MKQEPYFTDTLKGVVFVNMIASSTHFIDSALKKKYSPAALEPSFVSYYNFREFELLSMTYGAATFSESKHPKNSSL